VLSETELLRRCIAGERTAWDELVRLHVDVMYRMVSRLLPAPASATRHGDAEDVVQAVFLKLWEDDRRRLRSFQGRSRLSTWLVAIARREALDRLRHDRRDRERRAEAGQQALHRLQEDLRTLGPAEPEAALAAREAAQAFTFAVDSLPSRDRLLVRLVYEDGCTYREAADVLQARENSIGPWLKRAQVRLRAALAPETEG
jgi:RNA polymerase sigma-70 factor (ECF subfamily)